MENNELVHHGVKGMKWGVRRYQNEDGTLTEEGIRKYRTREIFEMDRRNKQNAYGLSAAAAGAAAMMSTAKNYSNPYISSSQMAAAAGISAGISLIGTAAANNIIRLYARKKAISIYDESISAGKEVTDDIISTYGKQKIKS